MAGAAAAPMDATGDAAATAVDPRLERALELASSNPVGAKNVAWLREHGMPIDVYEDSVYQCLMPGSGGSFLPKTGRINIPSSALDDTKWAAVMLTHETRHAMDSTEAGNAGLKLLGGFPDAIWAGATGIFQGENPATAAVDRFNVDLRYSEMNAYHDGAEVARTLGMKMGSRFGMHDDGTVMSKQEIRDQLTHEPLYHARTPVRAMMGGLLGVVALGTLAITRHAVIPRVITNPAISEPIVKWTGRAALAAFAASYGADLIGSHRYEHPPANPDGTPGTSPVPAEPSSLEDCLLPKPS
jgi:hypothetical protein